MESFEHKRQRLNQLLQEHKADALWLRRNANIAWLTDGARSYIDTSTEQAVASLLLTPRGDVVLTNNIEADRLVHEEGLTPPATCLAEPWYASHAAPPLMYTEGLRVACDMPLAGAPKMPCLQAELLKQRAPLSQQELDRYAKLGHDAAEAMYQVASTLHPNMSEFAAAGQIAQATYALGALPIVVLVAGADRMQTVRHPLPTAAPLKRSAMLVLCAQRQGLVVSLTRLIAFGKPTPEMEHAAQAAAQVDAAAILATGPGQPMSAVFAKICAAYAEVGYADAWQHHHQGGPCSYNARDWLVTPDCHDPVQENQAFAWNPSVPGAKSEDTFAVTPNGPKLLTRGKQWPYKPVTQGNQIIERPAILVV